MKTVKFRILVRRADGSEIWENDERVIGTQKSIRGYGLQPKFTGDINKWGKEIVDWFNKGVTNGKYRKFIRAELVDKDYIR